jgi:DNA-binding NtrC family response regulator
MNNGSILIIDDNKAVLTALEDVVHQQFGNVQTASNPNLIPGLLEDHAFDLILLDMNFSAGQRTGNEGLYWLRTIRKSDPSISIVTMTAYADIELAVTALKEGATDFVIKPWNNEKLRATLQSAWQLSRSKKEVSQLKLKEQHLKTSLLQKRAILYAPDSPMHEVMKLVHKVAQTDANVLITGEHGTGKGLVAQALHQASKRSAEALITVDMGAVAESLFESELFGHLKGAFTDAREPRAGKFEAADKGTLFLDEIGNLPLHLQTKLLAALQNRTINRIGSNQQIPIDIRLVCATNSNLERLVKEGLFREDLLFRINTITIHIPPLRERPEDIPYVADFYLKRYSERYGREQLKLNQAAQNKLTKYGWPGNIRELQHAIEKAVILSDGKVLGPDDFLFRAESLPIPDESPGTLEEMERRMIMGALKRHEGNYTAAADQLGISRQTLYNKIKKWDGQ